MNRFSVELTESRVRSAADRQSISNFVGQMPVERCTFTEGRKLYFRPGLNMRKPDEHPRWITHPLFRPTTVIRWKPGQYAFLYTLRRTVGLNL